MDDERTLYLAAAVLHFQRLCPDHLAVKAFASALQLGYAIGTAENPADYVPVVAVKDAETNKAQRQHFANQAQELGFAGLAGGGVW